MIDNRGSRPGALRGRDANVHVILRNGYSTKKAGVAPWPAGSVRWTLEGHPFDVMQWSEA